MEEGSGGGGGDSSFLQDWPSPVSSKEPEGVPHPPAPSAMLTCSEDTWQSFKSCLDSPQIAWRGSPSDCPVLGWDPTGPSAHPSSAAPVLPGQGEHLTCPRGSGPDPQDPCGSPEILPALNLNPHG